MIRFKKQDDVKPAVAKPAPKATPDTKPDPVARKIASKGKKAAADESGTLDLVAPEDRDT